MKPILLAGVLSLALVSSCGVCKKCPAQRDSVVVRYVDSLVVRDSVVEVVLPKEKVVDVVAAYDTLTMETSVAKSVSYVDTTLHMLKGSLVTKDAPVEVVVQYKDRVVYRDSVVVKEAIKEVPVYKETIPKSFWWMLGFCVVTAILLMLRVIVYFRK